jgi:hypothetical protein
MDSIQSVLGRKDFDQPPEVQIIKDFVRDNYQQTVQVTVKPAQIIIGVKGAALAGALRVRLHELQELCQTQKRLVIRIG